MKNTFLPFLFRFHCLEIYLSISLRRQYLLWVVFLEMENNDRTRREQKLQLRHRRDLNSGGQSPIDF